MKTKLIVAAVVAVSAFANLSNVDAQEVQTQQYQIQQQQQQIQPQIVTPKLGIHAIEVYGSVEVTSVFFNTPAKRLGLEAGDRILQVNGRHIRSLFDLQQALQHAANFRNGQIRVLVDNVRARHGEPVQRYVSVATYLNGFAPVFDPQTNPVPAYSVQQ